MVILAAAITAHYGFHLAGAWRWIYVAGGLTAQYFNSFVLVFYLVAGFLAVKGFHPAGLVSEPKGVTG